MVPVLWWPWCHYLSIQAANWDFTTPSFLGRGFLCCLLHVQMYKIPHVWLKLDFPSAVVPEPARVWKPTRGHTNSSLGSVNGYYRYLDIIELFLSVKSQLQGREDFSTSEHSDYLQWEIRSEACVGRVYISMWAIRIFWIWSYLFSSWKRAVKQGNLKLPEHILPPYCWALKS